MKEIHCTVEDSQRTHTTKHEKHLQLKEINLLIY